MAGFDITWRRPRANSADTEPFCTVKRLTDNYYDNGAGAWVPTRVVGSFLAMTQGYDWTATGDSLNQTFDWSLAGATYTGSTFALSRKTNLTAAAYGANTAYNPGDMVSSANVLYVCIKSIAINTNRTIAQRVTDLTMTSIPGNICYGLVASTGGGVYFGGYATAATATISLLLGSTGTSIGSVGIRYLSDITTATITATANNIWTATTSITEKDSLVEISIINDFHSSYSGGDTFFVGEYLKEGAYIYSCLDATSPAAPPVTATSNSSWQYVAVATEDSVNIDIATTYATPSAPRAFIDIVQEVQQRARISQCNRSTFTTDSNTKLIIKYVNDVIDDINDNKSLDALTARGYFYTVPGLNYYGISIPNSDNGINTVDNLFYNGIEIKPISDTEFQLMKSAQFAAYPTTSTTFMNYRLAGRSNNAITIEFITTPATRSKVAFEAMMRAKNLVNADDISPINSDILVWGALSKFKMDQGDDYTVEQGIYASKISSKQFQEDSNLRYVRA